jgi:tetratricopeptide (TPR) repeat protein
LSAASFSTSIGAHQAALALGAALEIYNSPLRQPGEPEDGSYKTVADRAKAANSSSSSTSPIATAAFEQGKIARYFAGLTDIDLGKTADAETSLKSVSGSYNKDLSALAKVALAGLYVQTGKTQQAIDLYKQLIAKPTDTVPGSGRAIAAWPHLRKDRPACRPSRSTPC